MIRSKIFHVLRGPTIKIGARSLAFAFAWSVLPFPFFLIAAFCLYLVPLFDARRFRFLFFVLLGIAWFLPPHALSFLLLAVLFFVLCGIRYLVFVDRVHAYELLLFILCIALSFLFFSHVNRLDFCIAPSLDFLSRVSCLNGDAVIIAAILASVFFKLFQGFFAYTHASGAVQSGRERALFLFPAFLSFILFELTLALLFLPIHIFSQTAFLFLAAVSGVDIALDHARGVLGERRILIALSVFLSAAVLILLSNQWGL